jgi:hypothetical protein
MSIGSTIPPPFRPLTIPGQSPDRKMLRELQALTTPRKMTLLDSTHPCFTPERVVEGLGMTRGQETDWARHIAKAMDSPNELVMRQDIMSKMFEERMEAQLRRVLFARSMSLWREKSRMAKSVSVVSVEDLKKAGPYIGPRGGRYEDAKLTIPWKEKKKGKRKPTTKQIWEGWKKAPLSVQTRGAFRHTNKALPGVTLIEEGDAWSIEVKGKKSPRFRARMGALNWLEENIEKEKLIKADPRGGTYIKRVPKPGGGFRYFYDEDKYNAHDGAHVSGEDAATAAITKAVAKHVKDAGKDGCGLDMLKPLAKRYGAEMVGGYLNEMCGQGSLVYRNKRLWAKGTAPKKDMKGKIKKTKQTKQTKQTKKEVQKSTRRFFVPGEVLCKGGPYIGPKGGKWKDPQHKIPWKEEKKTLSQIETPAFKKWFGNSKVVDEKGKPKIMYHGTIAGHEKFDPAMRGKFTNEDKGAELAFFFIDNKADADFYAQRAVERSGSTAEVKTRIMPVYLRAVKILDNTEEALGDHFEDLSENDAAFIEYAIENGYDAVRWPDGNDVNTPGTLAVFEPDQIKIAANKKADKPLKKAEQFVLEKAHKYIRREPKPGGGYRYYYRERGVS